MGNQKFNEGKLKAELKAAGDKQMGDEKAQVARMAEAEREILRDSETVAEANGLLKIVQTVAGALHGATPRQRTLVRKVVDMAFTVIPAPPDVKLPDEQMAERSERDHE